MGVGDCQFHHPNDQLEYIVATLDWVGVCWSVLSLCFSVQGGKCLARDLYMLRWHLDGKVVACSGHFLNPWIIASGCCFGGMYF